MTDILVVDDDPGAIQILGRVLDGVGHVRFAANGADALRLCHASAPDLILLDAEMPGMSGFEVCAKLRSELKFLDVPILFVTSHRDESFELAGFDAGASDFITKPVMPRLVLARVMAQLRVKRMADELRRNAALDPLTGLANRRRFDEAFEQEWLRARRQRSPIAIVLADVDHFKRYNDSYGHPAGDTCLRAIADALKAGALRPADLVARWGGEEFAVLLPDTPARGAEHVARRLLEAVDALALPHSASLTADRVTISAGIACYGAPDGEWLQAPSRLVELADRCLYAAKDAGRGRVYLSELSDDERHPSEIGASARIITRSSGSRAS